MKLLIILLLITNTALANKDKNIPKNLNLDSVAYSLCKEHTIRYAYVIKIAYVGLYLKNCNAEKDLLNITDKLIRFNYQLDVKADVFINAAKKFYVKNTKTKLSAQEEKVLDKFNQLYVNIKESEYFDLYHQKNTNLKLYKNGELLGGSQNSTFAAKYFNIWFGDEPSVKSLKKAFTS